MHEVQVFAGYGIVIVRRIDHLVVMYAAGVRASRWVEAELSDDEAKEAQAGKQSVHALLLRVRARGGERPLRPLKY